MLPRFAVAATAAVAMVAFARFQRDPQHAAELTYLAVLAAVLLAAAAALPRRPGSGGVAGAARAAGAALTGGDPLPWTAVLAVLAAVSLPSGPGRGAAVVTVLTAGLGLGFLWTVGSLRGNGTGRDAGHAGRRHLGLLPWLAEASALLPLAVAVQALFRGEMLLVARPDVHTLLVFLGLPVAAAAATAVIAARHGRATSLLAAATVVLAGNGLHAASTLALLAVAAGEVLARPPGMHPADAAERPDGAALFAPPGLLPRAAAVAVLVAPFAWQIRTAALAAAAGLLVAALRLRRPPADGTASTARWLTALAAVSLAVLVAVAVVAPAAGLAASGRRLVWGLLLVPFLPLTLWPPRAPARDADERSRWPGLVAGLVLAIAAARCAPRPEALAIPLAVLALTFAGRRGAGAFQTAWSGALVFAAALAASYPWLRSEPAASVLAALHLAPADGDNAWRALGFVVVANLVAAALASRLAARARATATPAPAPRTVALTVVLLAVLAFGAAPPPRLLLVPVPGVNLTAAEPRLEVTGAELRAAAGSAADAERAAAAGPPMLHGVGVDGNLSHAVDLAAGTPVATLRAYAAGAVTAEWTLRAGDDLAEWAARRPDVGAALAHPAPPPWQTWVAPSGDHFGQIYRVTLLAGDAFAANRLVVERHPDLPPQVVVHVERLEGLR